MKESILNTIIKRACEIWSVNIDELNADTTFSSFSPKSVHFAQMTTYLEDIYDIEVAYMQFKRCETLGEAAAFISELMEV